MDLELSFSFLIGTSGFILFIIGVGLDRLFGVGQKIHKYGLDRPMDLNFFEQFALYLRHPTVSIPITFLFFGAFMIFLSVIMAIVGIFFGS